jgi:hypothetical protein
LPSTSPKAWILVLSPPRERPIVWSSPAFFGGARAMLVGAHDRAVDHRVFVVGVRGVFGPTAGAGGSLCRRRTAPAHHAVASRYVSKHAVPSVRSGQYRHLPVGTSYHLACEKEAGR